MSNHWIPYNLPDNAAKAAQDTHLRQVLRKATDHCISKRTVALSAIPLEEYRQRASDIRLRVLDEMPDLLDRFCSEAARTKACVHGPTDAASARDIVLNILESHNARKIVKSKSMVTEEIHLNAHLQDHGLEVVETDLGEYIVQLAGEPPSHILAPAMHKSRQEIGRLFHEKLGVDYSEEPAVLTKIARKALREKFLAADAGITGANFAIAETGSLVLFTNEGNGRMATTLPRLHVAVFSIEKLLPSLDDLCTFIRLLPRSASGQIISSYLSVISGARRIGERTGAQELHMVLVDNGRTDILKSDYRDILKCIRCSACLNVCPVYRTIGGHAYATTYPGPMGVVLTTLLDGMHKAHRLLDGSTLCGACDDVCPVKVPFRKLLRKLREQRIEEGYGPKWERAAMAGFGIAAGNKILFRCAQQLMKFCDPASKGLDTFRMMKSLPLQAGRIMGRKR